jgi:homoserine kinase
MTRPAPGLATARLTTGTVHVRVPATSANLGPGFDALGLALALYDDVAVSVASSGVAVDIVGEGADRLPRGDRHLIACTVLSGLDRLGVRPAGLRISCTNRIPHARGLGSSAAAIIAGLLAARALVADGECRLDVECRLDDAALLKLAAEMEGHPDNVAACLLGGLTVAWTEDGAARAVRLQPVDSLKPVVFVPATRATTAQVRRLLPDSVPHADAAANAGRAALMLAALTTRPDLLLPATVDYLHQPYRAPAMPETAEFVARLRAAGVPAVVSGAGPAVLALGQGPSGLPPPPSGWSALSLPVDRVGAQVRRPD